MRLELATALSVTLLCPIKNSTWSSRLFIMDYMKPLNCFLWMTIFHLIITHSTEDKCQRETEKLRVQIKTLENHYAKRHQLLKNLRNQSAERPETGNGIMNLGDKSVHADCAHVFKSGNKETGFYMIKPTNSTVPVKMYCDMSEGGGWTVLQRRMDGTESFDRGWSDYKRGFGAMDSGTGEFWLGNDNLHFLTSQEECTLRITMEDFEGVRRFAVYKNFKVSDEKNKYQLSFGEYAGNAGNALAGGDHPEVQWWASHQGMKFTTFDSDNDQYGQNCAQEDKSGWWFNRCHSANLNGLYYQGPYSAVTDNGIVWYTWHGWWYSLKSVVMKIRPTHFESNGI